MSNIKWVMVSGLAALAATIGLAGTATAFHGGGVAHCDGCHSMHNSLDNPVEGNPNNLLLKGSDPSSTCLNCHAGAGSSRSYHSMSADGTVWSPAGDFFWLTQSYTNTNWSGSVTSDPDNMGHNVIALDFGLTVDATNAAAPGGGYPSGILGCQSCHDPHGQVGTGGTAPISVSGSYGDVPVAGTIAGNYRLLEDSFATAPTAVTAGYGETDASHVAYGENMGEWCAGCHGDYINDNHKHPSGNGEFLNGQATVYNAYVATGDFTGLPATSFDALVQFERQETDKAVLLAAVTSTAGPDSTDNVMCMTCHRAHASAFNNITRWDMEHEMLAEGWPTAANLAAMGAVPNADYYGRDITTEYGEFQRSLCNKCHVKD
ncbi:MAG: cytochrome C [Deltaproteobacteria bacterium]|nr:cytochrome C [Deltaproteobacteria bacterium]MBW2576486.1 cytochrome C [Deltaproteobacteria bacterium]